MAGIENIGSPPASAPQVVSARRRNASRATLEGTESSDIRDEKEDLKMAAEQSLNTVIDIGLDGIIRWVSPSWKDVVGHPTESIKNTPIASILHSPDKTAFLTAMESMKQDNQRSHIVRFQVEMGPGSILRRDEVPGTFSSRGLDISEGPEKDGKAILSLEGQGIMVYDRSSGGESHVRNLRTLLVVLTDVQYRQCGWSDLRRNLVRSPLTYLAN